MQHINMQHRLLKQVRLHNAVDFKPNYRQHVGLDDYVRGPNKKNSVNTAVN